MRWKILLVVAIAGVSFWLGRQSLPEIRERLAPPTPHEAYARRLADAGLDRAALGRLWLSAARRSLVEAPTVAAPFAEVGYLDPGEPVAVGYRFRGREGERLEFELELEGPTNALVFLDLFRNVEDRPPVRVASADSGERSLTFEPDRDGEFVVRIQPELLRGGRYTLTVVKRPSLAFPVWGGGAGSVGSYFGDPRDGGRRDHHGIDIFADRGTPVVAAVKGRVTRVRTTPIGGRVVWLRDEARGQSLYYAHLEAQLVARGARVRRGDTLGLVGNSGNARGTPPHLHFGIYRRGVGPLDPLPFVKPRDTVAPAPSLEASQAGSLRRTTVVLTLRAAPDSGAPALDRLDALTPVRVAGIAGDWLRVSLDDGRRGFLPASGTSRASALRSAEVAADAPLRRAPDPDAPEVSRLTPGARVEVLGRIGDHLLVRSGHREAWMSVGASP